MDYDLASPAPDECREQEVKCRLPRLPLPSTTHFPTIAHLTRSCSPPPGAGEDRVRGAFRCFGDPRHHNLLPLTQTLVPPGRGGQGHKPVTSYTSRMGEGEEATNRTLPLHVNQAHGLQLGFSGAGLMWRRIPRSKGRIRVDGREQIPVNGCMTYRHGSETEAIHSRGGDVILRHAKEHNGSREGCRDRTSAGLRRSETRRMTEEGHGRKGGIPLTPTLTRQGRGGNEGSIPLTITVSPVGQ